MWFSLLWSLTLYAQHPHYVVKDDESGLPTNEVYSIIQDKDGFLWLGSDAGLSRFNGVRFKNYTCTSQASKSISGLCISKTGKLYCYNFKGQFFQVFKGKMSEIIHPYGGIQDITTDSSGNVILNHYKGIAIWNEETKKWKNYNQFGVKATYVYPSFTKSAKSNNSGIYFITTEGIGKLQRGQLSIYKNADFRTLQLGAMIVVHSDASTWAFSSTEPVIYRLNNGLLKKYTNPSLAKLLQGKKITNVRFHSDGNLWICTYSGVIQFNPSSGKARLFYPQYSFSDVLMDNGGKFWFSTLHNGLLYVPNFNSLIWNKNESGLLSEKITKICSSNSAVFFTTGNGQLGNINQSSGQLSLYSTGNNADIQALYFDKSDDCLYFSQSNSIFSLKNAALRRVAVGHPSVKKILHFRNFYCFSSSNGLLLNRNQISPDFEIVNRVWTRDLLWIEATQELWTATNEGIIVYQLINDKLKEKKRYFSGKQMLSLACELNSKQVYGLSFDGEIVIFNPNTKARVFKRLNDLQGNNLLISSGRLYLATSRGLFSYDISNRKTNPSLHWKRRWTISDGLASNNVTELCILNGSAWIAGGRGVQRFAVNDLREPERGTIFLDKLLVNGKNVDSKTKLNLNQGQAIILFPESNLISEFGNYKFAYRFNRSGQWYEISGANEQIYIPTVPEGDFEIELKLEDGYGRDSINTIFLSGYMEPPFYRRTLFFVLVIFLILLSGFLIYRYQIKRLQRKQKGEIERLQLESDLRLTQQTALKAQMNPHFIFNVLNSIKSYIYKNEKSKAASYLSDFSDLIRGILNMTNLQYVSLAEELAFLKVYVELEGMMLGDEFEFDLEVDENLSLEQVEIPSLLLQPFIENAFKHGLLHKTGLKKLLISISQQEKGILICIKDNGVGRVRAMEINKERSAVHQSFATDATSKRVELINRDDKMNVTFDIVDNEKEGISTTVRILIQQKEA